MLYLNPPFYMFEGVPVVGDYQDPYQFYYYPDRPHLAVDEKGRPAIRFIAFKADLDEIEPGEDHATGFLVFDTSLAWSESKLRKVAQKIQDDRKLDQLPRLSPLLYKGGTVRLMFLDRTSEVTSDDPNKDKPKDENEPKKERWVPFLEASGVPSLYGENRAIFSAMLTKEATSLLFGAFEGFMPAGVIYDLTYVGMQRAFNVHVEADWEQVYHYIREQFSADLLFFSVETDKIISELEEKKIVKITASLEGVGDEGMEGEFNNVRKELQELVLDKFFKSAVNPNKPDEDPTADQIVDTLRDLGHIGSPQIGYSRKELDISEIRTIEVDYTVTRAVERRISPQAHLSLFFEDYNLTRDQVVTVVNGKDALWDEVEFDISVNTDFTSEGISAIAVDVYYGLPLANHPEDLPSTWSFLLDKANNRVKKAAWFNPDVGHQFRYRYTVFFAPGSIPGAQKSLSSGWQDHEGNLVVITPSDLYQLRQVEAVLTRNFPFDRYPQVHVHLQYKDPKTNWIYEDSTLLDQQTLRLPLALRIGRDAISDVNYRFSYLRSNGEKIDTTWQTTASDMILVQDPLPTMLSVRLLVGGDRSKIANLLVDFKYEDPENDVFESGSIILDSTNLSKVNEWKIPLVDPHKRRYSYNQTLIDIDGNMTQTGWIEEEKTTLPVGVIYAQIMEVQPELIGIPLSSRGLDMIKLNLRYKDLSNNYTTETQMQFTQPGKGEVWRVPLKKANLRDYQYEVIYVMKTGFERKVGPISSRDTFLVISSVPPK